MVMANKKTKVEAPKSRASDIVDNLRKLNSSSDSDIILMSGESVEEVPKRSSGILSLDLVTGGGYPEGRVIEVFGKESEGKTTIALHAIEAAQRNGGECIFVDAEHALDPSYAEKVGVDMSRLILNQPSCGEEALDTVVNASTVMKSGDIIVVDSVAALTPRAEIEGNMGDSHMGLQARLMGQAMRKLVSNLSKSGVIVIFINQIRLKIGLVFGNPETTTGGNALKFYSSIRLETRRGGVVKKGDTVIGCGVKVKTVKNKVFPPFKEAETSIIFGKGVPRSRDILTVGSLVGVIEKKGSWYSYEDTRLGQGLDNAVETIEDIGKDVLGEIETKVLDIYQIKRG